MANNLLMKGPDGRLMGYVQRWGTTVRCKLHTQEPGEDVQVTLLFSDGSRRSMRMPAGGEEAEWTGPEAGLTGGYVLCGEKLLGATSDAARAEGMRALAPARAAVSDAEAVKRPVCKPPPDVVQTREFPQRRWPPPPCRPLARYAGGIWVTPDETTNAAQPGHAGS